MQRPVILSDRPVGLRIAANVILSDRPVGPSIAANVILSDRPLGLRIAANVILSDRPVGPSIAKDLVAAVTRSFEPTNTTTAPGGADGNARGPQDDGGPTTRPRPSG